MSSFVSSIRSIVGSILIGTVFFVPSAGALPLDPDPPDCLAPLLATQDQRFSDDLLRSAPVSFAGVPNRNVPAAAGGAIGAGGRFMSRRRFLALSIGVIAGTFFGGYLLRPQRRLPYSADRLPETAEMMRFLQQHTFSDGMPRMFSVPEDWAAVGLTDAENVEQVIEAVMINSGSGLYDGAVRQVVLAKNGTFAAADVLTHVLRHNQWGRFSPLRAAAEPFRYGGGSLPSDQALFFRIFPHNYLQKNPLNGKELMSPYASAGGRPWPFAWPPKINWTDWKPIVGDNVWGAMIGPLQVAFERSGGAVPRDAPEVALALSIVPALAALQADIGALYHAPAGTADCRPDEISIENITSARAALDMVYAITGNETALQIIRGLDAFMQQYAFDRTNGVFYQGGLYQSGGSYQPTTAFAVDTQTWPYLVWGPQIIEQWYGSGIAFKNWRELVRRGGFYRNGLLQGVGFTDQRNCRNPVLSAEWTAGAIAAGTVIADYYERQNRPSWARQIRGDVERMRQGVAGLRVALPSGGIAYLYTDKSTTRETLPFGWIGRALPSTAATGWMVCIDMDINPFMLKTPLSQQPHLRVVPQRSTGGMDAPADSFFRSPALSGAVGISI